MMKKILIILLLLIPVRLKAPADNRPILVSSEIRHPYATIIQAIGSVESNRDPSAYNAKEKAVGYFQIRDIRVKDFNQRTGMNYRHKDMYDYTKAVTVFMYYASDFTPDEYEAIAKEWNKSVSDKYWNKVKKKLSVCRFNDR